MADAEVQATVYRFDQFWLDTSRGTLHGSGDVILEVRPKAFALLRFLVENPGRLHERATLLDTLWPDVVVTDDSLTQCVSELRHAFGDRAPLVLKTVPRRGYALTAEVRGEGGQTAHPSPSAAARTALVILEPFGHFGGGSAASLAGLLTTELLTELTRFEGLRVFPAPHGETAGGYRVRGEVRAAGRTLHVTVRIEDAATGGTFWAERLKGERARPSELPGGIVETLSAAVARQVNREDLSRARQKPDSELTVRDLSLLGREHHERGAEADTFIALEMFDRAIAADPNDALAYAWQAFTVQRVDTYGWGPPHGVRAARERALALARRAAQLAPDSPLCLSRLAFALILHQRWDEAVMTARAALRAGRPTDYAVLNSCAEVLAHAGHAAEAVEALQRALSLDSHCPPIAHCVLGRALLLDGKAEEALPELRWCTVHLPDYVPCLHSLVVAAAETGHMDEARAALREARRLQPHWVPRNHSGPWFFRLASDAERFLAAFRAAEPTESEAEQANDNLAATPPESGPATAPSPGRTPPPSHPVRRPAGST